MPHNERLVELADFLKTRRARLNPRDVGLPTTGRRRTPGLRREEVAELANISSTWYTWLEQGRPISISIRTGALIASALRLNDSERSHFFKLLEQPQGAEFQPAEAEGIDYEIQSVLDGLRFHPAFVLNHRWDLLAWNSAAEYVLHFGHGNEEMPPNFIRFIFASRYFRSVSVNWESDVRGILAQFRLDYDQYVHEDRALELLIEVVRRENPEFRSWWSEHNVIQRTGWAKELSHPAAGLLTFKSMVLERTSAPFPRVVIYVPELASIKKIEQFLNR